MAIARTISPGHPVGGSLKPTDQKLQVYVARGDNVVVRIMFSGSKPNVELTLSTQSGNREFDLTDATYFSISTAGNSRIQYQITEEQKPPPQKNDW